MEQLQVVNIEDIPPEQCAQILIDKLDGLELKKLERTNLEHCLNRLVTLAIAQVAAQITEADKIPKS